MKHAVGIDLGTTNSAVACIDAHGKPVIIRNAAGASTMPSVICFRRDEILVGHAAREMQALAMFPVAATFKRQMGDPLFLFHAKGEDFTATDLSAIILRALKAEAEADLRTKISEAVITVPAYFRDDARKATVEAGVAAGLEVLQVINEPTAAAAAYGFGNKQVGQRLVVYDLGGGTFDVTVLEFTTAGVKVLTSVGDAKLGGADWDERVVTFIAERFRDEFGSDPFDDAETTADLFAQSEAAKKALTSVESTMVSVTYDGCRGRYALGIGKFEEITSDLMERTVSLTKQALDSLELRAVDMGGVLLVGGSTRMPMVHRFAQEVFGQKPMAGVNVDEAVALGAAIIAAENLTRIGLAQPSMGLSESYRTVDVTNHSLGMIAVNTDQTAYVNSIILSKNTEIPCEETRPYQHHTREQGDNEIEVFVTQGEGGDPSAVTFIGRYVISGISHRESGPVTIDISYHYNRSGTVSVTAASQGANENLVVREMGLPADVDQRFLLPPNISNIAEPITAYLAFDLSGSMSGMPLEGAKQAAKGFLGNTDLSRCSLGVVAFSDNVRAKLRATQNARAIREAIEGLQACETGGGNSADPFTEIYSLLSTVKGRRFAIVLADGVWASQGLAIERAKKCHANDIEVIAIGFGGVDPDFLRAIASVEEAGFFTTLAELTETFSTIAQVISEAGQRRLSASSGHGDGFLAGIRGRLSK